MFCVDHNISITTNSIGATVANYSCSVALFRALARALTADFRSFGLNSLFSPPGVAKRGLSFAPLQNSFDHLDTEWAIFFGINPGLHKGMQEQLSQYSRSHSIIVDMLSRSGEAREAGLRGGPSR